MERFMCVEGEQLQDAQAQSMAADELSALVPAVNDAADMQGEFCLMELFLWLCC